MPRKKKRKQKNSNNPKTTVTNNNDNKKKSKLRTSLDVYNRLLHDRTLNIDLTDVMIIYNDNINGEQEMCIKDWVMIDKGGDIPMHHIIKFIVILKNNQSLILWDRINKLDRLYGSGNTKMEEKWINIKNTIHQKHGIHPILQCIDATINFIKSHDEIKDNDIDDEKNIDKYPQLLVGRATRKKSKFIHSKVSKRHKLIAAISAMVHKWGALSPFHLSDSEGKLIENVWQFSKVYDSIDAQNQVKFGKEKWIYPKVEKCVNHDGTLTDEYWKWRETGENHKKAVRFPVGRAGRFKCLYSIKNKNDLKKLNYIQSRKEIYIPLYISALVKCDKYKELKKLYDNGQCLLISEFDGPYYEDYEYYKNKYKKDDIVLEGNVMVPTKGNLKILLNDEKHPFGHGYCIAMALQDITINDLMD
eukprot:292573_1